MTRWMIERSGTGIERNGTGIERNGTGIERSGTGIERSGTGIESSGTGIESSGTGISQLSNGLRHCVFAIAISILTFASVAQASPVGPAGSMHLVVSGNTVAVSWIIDNSVFSSVSSLSGSFANLLLTEVALSSGLSSSNIAGGGTGSKIAGGGTGSRIAGGGTGSKIAGWWHRF